METFLSLFDPSDSNDFDCDNDENDDELLNSSITIPTQKKKVKKKKQKKTNNENHQRPIALNSLNTDDEYLPPEPQLGNIEYKLKLINPSKQRFEHLVTQMKWRLKNGNGEAIYEIGVSDSGYLHGLNKADMDTSLNTLNEMAQNLNASTTILRQMNRPNDKYVTEVLIRKIPDDQQNIEVLIAVLGGADAGKSTLLGVLTSGENDNGRGRARLNMFRHIHEIQTGRTSCISHETLGFDSQGSVINYKYSEFMTAEEIRDKSVKLVTFMDLAGHRRYMKTTVQALTGYSPHYALLIIQSSENLSQMAREHFAIMQALDVTFFVVITKIDIIRPEETIKQLKEFLNAVGYRKVPYVISTEEDVVNANTSIVSDQILPIFCISNVTGEGLTLLIKFLTILSPNTNHVENERLEKEHIEFHIDEIFKVAEVGPVVGGLLTEGILTENSRMKIGPLQEDGSFCPVTIQTIHRNRVPRRAVRVGQTASLSFAPQDKLPQLRTGMVLIPEDDETAYGSYFFQATISVVYHATAICKGFQSTVHIGSIRQTAIIECIMDSGHPRGISTNESASVLFRFVRHPEYVRPGMRLLFREGVSKGIGKVTQVFPLNQKLI
uniref:Putative translation elongation factor n=1 Tax=Corethrella appendiculata TaxID=1370023 RepID=U5EV72_9DIPT